MSSLFLTVLNMSITASYVALAVMIVRLFLKKAPKVFSYVLWSVVLFRLLIPFSFESPLSLMIDKKDSGIYQVLSMPNHDLTTSMAIGEEPNQTIIQSSMPSDNTFTSVGPLQIAIDIGTILWIIGIVLLLGYVGISYYKLRRKLATATLIKDHIFETDRISTPFVLGWIKPRIFVPVGLSGYEFDYILKHEQTHIRRYDYLIKPIAFFTLAVHWFNPIIWLSYFLMVKDMEMSCDESVIKQSKEDIRVDYSNSLLSLSTKQSGLFNPLAFGESNVKSRIKNVLNYKSPSFWIRTLTFIVIIVVAIGLITNPKSINGSANNEIKLFQYKTPYVGDASKVGKIVSMLKFPESMTYESISLATAVPPYGLTVNLVMDLEASFDHTDPALQVPLQKNAIILFALIDNVDDVNFKIMSGAHEDLVSFTRDGAGVLIGINIRQFSQDENQFAQLLQLTDYLDVNFDQYLKVAKYHEDRDEIIRLVEVFGRKIQSVSLLGPNVADSIRENYSPYVTPELLDQWINDPEKAPGRLLSSPWPDRIEVRDMSISSYNAEVKGHIIEMTSVEMVEGGYAARQKITLSLKKKDGQWLIDEVTLGEYED